MTGSELERRSKTELEAARTRGQVVGWIQGAGAVVAAGLVFNLIGWLPTVLVLGGVGYLIYRAIR